MFEVVGQDIISGNMGFIGTDPDRLYRMGAAEKTEDVTVTGNPAVLDNATGKSFKDLHIYGRSEQVTTTGAQLLISTKEQESNVGVTLTKKENGLWHLEGTNTEATSRNIRLVEPKERFKLPEGTYTISVGAVGIYQQLSVTTARVKNPDDGSSQEWTVIANAGINSSTKFVCDGTEEALSLFVIFNGNATLDCDLYVMLNSGDAALPWEPYTGGKPSPSPEYPQEIVNDGKDGNLNVMVRGKNVFAGRFYYARYSNGILFIDKRRKDEEVKFPYQPETEAGGICKALKCQKGKTYVISVTNPNKNAAIGMAEYENIEKTINTNNALGFVTMYDASEKSYTAKSDGILVCGIAGKWTDGSTTTHECTESELLQVEEASEATSYEPYHEPQSMSVTTPNGLPGIPVSSRGNYTDENGQQWICDEIDFGRGVYVKRVYTVDVDGVNVYFSQYATFCNMSLRMLPMCKYAGNSGQQTFAKSTFTSEEWKFNEANRFLYILKGDYAEILNESCKKHHGEVIYALATPIETPLTDAEIAAYKSLRTYRGTTIVEAEDKVGISVTYKCNTKAAEKEVNILHADLMAEMEELDENSEIV